MNSTAEFILFNHPNLKCNRNGYVNMGNKYINIRKLMDNFCEDSNYIRNHIEDYKQKGTCKAIISKITSNKNHLNQQLSDVDREFGEEAGAEEIQQYLSESESPSNIKSTSIGLSLSGVVATGLLLYRFSRYSRK
ncbi:PIR Superfamily Protein [Plasmodium ovale wallikeri]|uniref:PIR Superfamily Protein n=1 Tax=Plasmodium ovale wallikeri TaxID=864142 RepID=A0A1A8YNM9_PLAOA|nr:PIR Superfamily Protein [Plasmodium ovale wallikeri]SBT33563.1 PIR Superfamily Protein [Plasmodium ovale wallikeri]